MKLYARTTVRTVLERAEQLLTVYARRHIRTQLKRKNVFARRKSELEAVCVCVCVRVLRNGYITAINAH